MDHIQDVYKKKPEMISKIWDHLTKVNLKVDGKPFQVVYNEDEDELEYHGRSGNETKVGPLIDDMQRLFSKPINDAIRHIETRKDIFKEYKFLTFEVIGGILLLTAIIDKSGKFVNDPKEIKEIADKLETDVMACLWEGKLSEEQKTTLMDAISTDIIPTKAEFVEWVKALFGTYKEFPKSLISRSEEFIEGLVFFYNVDGKIVEYKLVDPTYRNLVKDNQNKKQDEEVAKKFEKIYEIFVDWAEENGSALDKNRIKSIELNFINMMKDVKIYNKLMNLGSGLTLHQNDSYFLQLDRVSDDLRKEIKKHGNVYQLLFEKFVKLFYKGKKRAFIISKEFQERVNKLVEKFADYKLNENEIEINGELFMFEAIDYKNIITNIIDFIKNNIDNNEIISSFIKTYNRLKNTSTNFDQYCKNHGLDVKTVNHLLDELSSDGNDKVIEIINNNQNNKKKILFPKPKTNENTSLISIFKKIGLDNDDITALLQHKQKMGSSTNESDGPGEHAVALLFSNAKKSSSKGDLQIDYEGKGNYVPVEFKFGGGVMSSATCSGTARDIWNRIAEKLNKKIDWVDNGRLNDNILSWYPFDSLDSEVIKNHTSIIIDSVSKMYNGALKDHKSEMSSEIESEILNKIYEDIISINKKSNKTKKDQQTNIKEKRAVANRLIRLVGCLSLKAYAFFEEFDDIFVYQTKDDIISYIENVKNIPILDIFNNTLVSFSGAPKSTFGGGGMHIKAVKKVNLEKDGEQQK